jgi:hypothetical protein
MGLGEPFGGVITDFIVARAKKPEEGTDQNEERQASEVINPFRGNQSVSRPLSRSSICPGSLIF